MPRPLSRLLQIGAMLVLAACSDASRSSTPLAAPDDPDHLTLAPSPTNEVWDLALIEAEYGSRYSLDDSPEGQALPLYRDDSSLTEAVVCRSHTKAIDLWWDSPNEHGLVKFHLDPPLTFRSYTGAFTDRASFAWRRATYSVAQSSEGQDAAGNVWRFSGRFSAICRQGQTRVGFLNFDAQIVVAESPIDPPVLVRRGPIGGSGPGECTDEFQAEYDPFAPYSPGGCGGTGDDGGGGGGGGEIGGGGSCHSEYVVIEISYDGGQTWQVWWEGNATVCS